MQDANICQLMPSAAIRSIKIELMCPFDAQKVGLRLKGSLLEQKGAFAYANFDLKGSIRVRKPCTGVQTSCIWIVDNFIWNRGKLIGAYADGAECGVEFFSV